MRSPGTRVNPTFLQLISANHLAIAAGCAAGVGMCFFFCGVQLFAQRHSSNRAPRVTISSATPGLATIYGKASGSRTLASPFGGKPCFIYRTCILQLSAETKEWNNVAEETGHLTFLIEDETGKLLVEPSGAELDLRQNLGEAYEQQSSPSDTPSHNRPFNKKESIPEDVAIFLARNGISIDRPTRVEEYCLEPETPVVVTGTVIQNDAIHSDSDASTSAGTSSNQPVDIPKAPGDQVVLKPEVIRLSSGTVPQSTSQMSQQAKIAAALAKAGLTTPDMWATSEGGLQAVNSVIDSHSTPEQSLPGSSDIPATRALALTTMTVTKTTMTMMKGPDDSAFIISNQPINPGSLSWKSVVLILAGSTLTTLSLYVVLLAHLR